MRYLQRSSQLLALLVDENASNIVSRPRHTVEEYESLVEIAVCDSTAMTPDRWATLNEAARIPWLEKAICVLSSKETTPRSGETKQPKAKPGRKSKPEQDEAIAKEYENGLVAGHWSGQADYLRKKHRNREGNLNAKKAWLSSLLKRVKERKLK